MIPDNTVVRVAITDSSGFYAFSEVEPGTYDIKETNLLTYPLHVSDDGDASDAD